MAHELAHLIGVTSEAEANFIAYHCTTNSGNIEVIYSGNFFILPYVLRDAKRFLSANEYDGYISRINPLIIGEYNNKRQHWDKLYNEKLADIQSFFYDHYLKSNNIPDGQKNYGEVIKVIINYKNRNNH